MDLILLFTCHSFFDEAKTDSSVETTAVWFTIVFVSSISSNNLGKKLLVILKHFLQISLVVVFLLNIHQLQYELCHNSSHVEFIR